MTADATTGAGRRRLTAGTGAAGFDEFYDATALRLVRYAYALTGNISDAQDIAQEAFARAWQRWDSVGGFDAPEAWVRRVATNLAISRYRRDRIARAAARYLIAADMPEISPDTVALVAALRTLPERQRVVVVRPLPPGRGERVDLPCGAARRRAALATEGGCSGPAGFERRGDRVRIHRLHEAGYSPSLSHPARQVLGLPPGSRLAPRGIAVGPGYLAWNTSTGASFVASAKTLAATRISDGTAGWGVVQGFGGYLLASRSAQPESVSRSLYLLSGSVIDGQTCAEPRRTGG